MISEQAPRLWYHVVLLRGIVNILSPYRVSTKHHVQCDSKEGNTFTVWKDDGTPRMFKPVHNGLYYYNTNTMEYTVLAMLDLDSDQICTIKESMVKYNQYQIKTAKTECYFQNTAALSTCAFLKMIDSGTMKNSPITRQAIKIAQEI